MYTNFPRKSDSFTYTNWSNLDQIFTKIMYFSKTWENLEKITHSYQILHYKGSLICKEADFIPMFVAHLRL